MDRDLAVRSEVVLMGRGLVVKSEVIKGKEGVFVMEVISGRVVEVVLFGGGVSGCCFRTAFIFLLGMEDCELWFTQFCAIRSWVLGGVVRFGDDDDLESVVGLNHGDSLYVECDIMVDVVR